MSDDTQSPKSKGGISKPIGIVLAIVILASLAVAGFNSLNPHTMTVTQQQIVVNSQNVYNTQTVTRLSTQIVSSVSIVVGSTSLPASYYQFCNNYNCSPYAPPGGSVNFGCYSSGPTNMGVYGNITVQCSGYLYSDANGCLDLLVPIDNGYTNQVQQYYFLQNLPATPPAVGTWIKVTGLLNLQGNNPGPNGGSCPSSSISVTSIT